MRALLIGLLAVVPSSSNFTLKKYDVGNGLGTSSSANYQLLPNVGAGSAILGSTNYSLPSGVVFTVTLAAPVAPQLTNPDASYNRLHLTLAAPAASDTKYLIAISSDNFATSQYVQPDQTIAATAGINCYKTFASWGGASGFWILGLPTGTTYAVKVAALQGKFTGSSFGPATSAVATSLPLATFSVGTGASATPPFTVSFPNMAANTITSASTTLEVGLTTNAQNGGAVHISDMRSGLFSASNNFTLASLSGDLATLGSGFGAQVTHVGQTGGGPLAARAPFDGSAEAIGALSTTAQEVARFTGPLSDGTVTIGLKAKAATLTPAATDYADTITLGAQLDF